MALRLNGAVTIGRGRRRTPASVTRTPKSYYFRTGSSPGSTCAYRQRAGGDKSRTWKARTGRWSTGCPWRNHVALGRQHRPVRQPRRRFPARVGRGAGGASRRSAAAPFGPVATMSPSFALTLAKLRRLAVTDAELAVRGRDGRGQGGLLAGGTRGVGAQGRVRGHQLRRASGGAGRERAVRLRRAARTRRRRTRRPASSSRRTAGRCCWTRSATCARRCRGRCSASCRTASCCRWGRRRRGPWTCACWRRPASRATRVRPDLRGRLGADPIEIPPLRERVEDIGGAGGAFRRRTRCVSWSRRRSGRCASTPGRSTCASWTSVDQARGRARGRRARARSSICPVAWRGGARAGRARRGARRIGRRPAGGARALLREQRGNVAAVAKSLDRQWNVV